MKKILLTSLFIMIPTFAMADDYRSCKKLEKTEKRYLPEVVDNILTINSFKCSMNDGRVVGNYIHYADASVYTKKMIKDGWKRTLNVVCKYGKKNIRNFDMKYSYYSQKGSYIGSNYYTSNDCK
jgi:hypothetical protein